MATGQPGPADTGVADQAGEVPEPTTPTVADPPPEVAAATDDTDESAATDDTDDAAIDDSDAAAAVDVPDEDPPADPVVTEPADTTPTKPADTTPTKPADPPPASSVSVSRLKGRGWAAIDKGQVPDAIDTFKRAVAQAPNDPEAQYGLGYSYLQANDKAQAKVHLCRAQSLSRGNVDISRQVAGELKSQGLSCP